MIQSDKVSDKRSSIDIEDIEMLFAKHSDPIEIEIANKIVGIINEYADNVSDEWKIVMYARSVALAQLITNTADRHDEYDYVVAKNILRLAATMRKTKVN